MKLGLALGGLLLVAPGLVACGGDDSSAKDDPGGSGAATVSVEKFCAAAETFENTFAGIDASDFASSVKQFKEAAQALKDTGTPEDIPADAKEGLALTLDKIIGLPDDATEEDMGAIFEFTDDEKAKSMAFETYLDKTCDYRSPSPSSAP